MQYITIESSKRSLRKPCGAHSPQVSNEEAKASNIVSCVTCQRERTPVEVLREERISVPRRLAESDLVPKDKQNMARELLRSVDNWTVRPKPEFFARTRPMPLTESDRYPKGFFERLPKRRTSLARFVQRVKRMGESSSEEERRESDMALFRNIPTDLKHPDRRLPYAPVGRPVLPAGTQWWSRSQSTPVRHQKVSHCVHTTFIFAENTNVHLRRLAAQNRLNLRVGDSIHAEIVIKDNNLENTPLYRRHADTKLPVARPGRWVRCLVWHGEEFCHKWGSMSVCATNSSSLPRVQRPRPKKRRVAPQSALMKAVWGESQIRSAISREWEWLRCRYLSVEGSDRDVLKSLIDDQMRQWQEADRKASEEVKKRLKTQRSLGRTVLGPSNAFLARGGSPPQL